ncbi:hypothetical protein SDC9_208285 [bioreactor metagenome]|uniref:Uncharacterized protein n=1 Tax=bioreactor metagenome TaxID=1076179 RepID=A0A645JAV7_9ZZZZ
MAFKADGAVVKRGGKDRRVKTEIPACFFKLLKGKYAPAALLVARLKIAGGKPADFAVFNQIYHFTISGVYFARRRFKKTFRSASTIAN